MPKKASKENRSRIYSNQNNLKTFLRKEKNIIEVACSRNPWNENRERSTISNMRNENMKREKHEKRNENMKTPISFGFFNEFYEFMISFSAS